MQQRSRSRFMRSPAPWSVGGRVSLGQRLLERVVAEHRALQAGRADVDAEEVEEVVARKASTSATGLPLISSVRRLALAWLIAQPRR
jgi:hypothetical protein